MGQQHREITVEYTDSDGNDASTTMLEAQFDSGQRRMGMRWYQCPVCLEEIPARDVHWVHGKAYCAADAADVLHDEWIARHRRVR